MSDPRDESSVVLREQLRAHVLLLRTAVPALLTAGLALSVAQWRHVSHLAVAIWAALLVSALLFRGLVALAFHSSAAFTADPPDLASLETWRTRFRLTFVFHGLVWGAAAWLLFPAVDVPRQLVLTLAIATVCIGSITAAAFDLSAAFAFTATAVLPLIARLLYEGGEVGIFMGLLVVLLLGYIRMGALRAHGSLRENAVLRALEGDRADALRRSEALLERTGEMVGAGGWELDVNPLRVRWTTQTYRIHEVDPGQPPSLESSIDFYAPEARPVIKRAVEEAIANGTPFDLEVPFVTASGRSIWVRTMGQPQIEDGKVVRLTGAFQDVTARHRMEAEERAYHAETLRFQNALLAVRDYEGGDLAGFFRLVTEQSARALGVERASVWLFDETRQHLVCEDLFILSRGVHEKAKTLDRSELPAYFAALERHDSLLAHDVRQHPATVELAATIAPSYGISSLLNAPLRRGDQMVGELSFGHVGEARHWTVEDERFATSLAAAVLLARENAQRREVESRLVRQNQFLEALQQTTLDLLARHDLDDLLQALVERATSLLEAPFGELALREGDALVIRAFTKNHPYKRGDRLTRADAPLSFRVYDTLRPVVVAEYAELPHEPNRYDSHDLHAVAEFPILLGNRWLGILSVGRMEPGRVFSQEEISRGEMLAHHAALVVHNAGIYAEAVHEAEARTVELRESEDRFRRIFENSPLTLAVASVPEGRFLAVNPAAETLFGYSAEEAVGHTTEELNIWVDLAERERYLEILRSEGRVDGFETTMRRRDGEVINVLFSTALMKMEGGEDRSLVTVLDITERRRAEHAIRQFRAALDQSTDAIYLIDPYTGRFIDLNETAHLRLGYTREEHVALTLADIEADGPGVAHWRDQLDALRRIGHLTFEGLHRRKDGSTLPVEVNVRYSVGPPQDFMIAIVRDITERKSTEEAMRESEERFHAVFDHSPVIIALLSVPDGRIVELNAASLAAFGYTREEAIGRTSAELSLWVSERDRDLYLERLKADHSVSGFETEMRRKDGSIFPAVYFGTMIQVGGQAFSLNMVQDITLRKRAEISLSRLNLELEDKVEERTAELEMARRLAEQASEAKSEFLANMSHEIRTPLNGVLGMIDVLRQTPLKSHQSQMADLAHESATSLLSIIEDILDFSKIEAGMVEVERAPMSVGGVAEKVCDLLDQVAAKKGVELTLFTDPRLPDSVMGDAMRLRQVLHNIVGNAIKFSSAQAQPRRVSVRVLFLQDHEDFVSAEFQITDNGIGMDRDGLSRLFNSFTQADASITRRFGGTGLGLSISRNLTRLMGGDIHVESEPGQGSTFSVRLPFPISNAVNATAPLPDLSDLSCVVVGGPSTLAADLTVYLTAAQARVEVAVDLRAARAFLAKPPRHERIIIVDPAEGSITVDKARMLLGLGSDDRVRLVILGRGRRRRPRKVRPEVVAVDGNVLARRTFLNAVALVTGRIVDQDNTEKDAKAFPAFAPDEETQGRPGHLILVAEDNKINQRVIQQQLRTLGYATHVVDDGREALRRWEIGEYAMLVTDLQMPDMDGYELSSAIRALEATRGRAPVPIVALTANALKDEAERCRAAGMNDYLTKPAGLAEMKAVLEKWLPAMAARDENKDPVV